RHTAGTELAMLFVVRHVWGMRGGYGAGVRWYYLSAGPVQLRKTIEETEKRRRSDANRAGGESRHALERACEACARRARTSLTDCAIALPSIRRELRGVHRAKEKMTVFQEIMLVAALLLLISLIIVALVCALRLNRISRQLDALLEKRAYSPPDGFGTD